MPLYVNSLHQAECLLNELMRLRLPNLINWYPEYIFLLQFKEIIDFRNAKGVKIALL